MDDPTRSPIPPDRPFTAAAAHAAGLSRGVLCRWVRDGHVRRVVRGVYLATGVPDTVETRARCLALVVPPDCVVVDRHAGWLHGAAMTLAPGEHLALRPLSLFRAPGAGRLRHGLTRSGERDLSPDDVEHVRGVRVTTPLRTACDLGRVRWADEAIAGLDAMLGLGAFSHEELLAATRRFVGARWVRTLRAVAPLADGRAESPPESVLRLRCHEAGLRVEPQLIVRGPQGPLRLDLGDEESHLAVEYDGAEWHSSPSQREHDARRRRDLRRAGWQVETFVASDVFGRLRTVDERLLRLAAQQARARRSA